MAGLTFLFKIFLNVILTVFLLRALLQWVRANFRNPITQAITKLTNPLIMPLRKVLPPIGKIDTASILSCLLIALAMNFILILLSNGSITTITARPLNFLFSGLILLIFSLIQLYVALIFFAIILSWVQPRQHSPLTAFLNELTEPLLNPARRLIKPIGGLDLSPALVILLLLALQIQIGAWLN